MNFPRSTNETQLHSLRWAVWTSFLFTLLQSACTAVLALSGVRVAIGLGALAAAGGTYAPAAGLHQDAIRIPMLTVGGIGAVLNLAVLVRVWILRGRSSGGWRRRTVSTKERRSEGLQVVLAVLTLALVGAEVWTHSRIHKKRPQPVVSSRSCLQRSGCSPGTDANETA